MAKTKNVMATINFLTFLLSVPVIGSGIWLAMDAKISCVKILHWPVIILGILILIVALAGVTGGFWRIQPLIVAYYIGMVIVIILLACLVIFICKVTARGSSYTVPGLSYKAYEPDDYSDFLFHLTSTYWSHNKWNGIASCLNSTGMCAELNQTYGSAQDFLNAHITPFQAGCCTPPKLCNFTYVNLTYWIPPSPIPYDWGGPDCSNWSNEQKKLCYNCTSCRAGLLYNLTTDWKRANLILIFTLVALIIVYTMGCFALVNAEFEEIFR